MEAAIVFPHQLFENNPIIKPGRLVYLMEEYLFFNQYNFHKQKLLFHRSSMKYYEHFLLENCIEVVYIEAHQPESDIRTLITQLIEKSIFAIDPVDNYLERRLKDSCRKRGIVLHMSQNPSFLNTTDDLKYFFKPAKEKFFQTDFYIQQRKSKRILIDEHGKPVGGNWTYDKENRKKYPVKKIPPAILLPSTTTLHEEALAYVNKHFSNNNGEIDDKPLYPHTFQDAKFWLKQFLEHRFSEFGYFEDAIVSSQGILHHSVLSPLLNSGLLLPGATVQTILEYADHHQVALNNTEGLIRQIIGWREFIRGVYITKGSEERTKNFWGFSRKIPDSFYTGTTGIDPIDITVKKLLKTGYNHHIERLMVLGNFMLLCEFDPNEVYRWFMEMFIDAYDWVMVPNVYGMSQFADGGIMSTKPYISGSNYLKKMSNYPSGEWQAIWDGLFWRFLNEYRDFFLSNPRLGMLVRTFDKMSADKRASHLRNAEAFISKL